ncbi:MAG: hypothetical protein PCFJNLEI_01684 [Verrucomicrobiae bacterium]|nr:hypothetical protein [Verrucomicrobiae bacterium]
MATKPEPQRPTMPPAARCKVCTKNIRAGEDRVEVYHAGAYYTVCCVSCAAKFEAAPHQYVIHH